jgi:hypothetical protein
MGFLRPLESFMGIFQRLFRMFVSGLVIFFPVVSGGAPVCVCGEFVEFGSSLMRVIWHGVLPSYVTSHHRTILSSALFNWEHPRCVDLP